MAVITISFLIAAAAIWTESSYLSLSFWGTVVLFGCGGLVMLYRLLNPSNVFVTLDSERGKQLLAQQFAAIQADQGAISYNDSGFAVMHLSGPHYYAWADLETAFGYKADEYVTDQICLDLFLSNGVRFNISEETPGWHQFLIRLHQSVPAIIPDWYIAIAVPAFEPCLTLLFDKEGRTQAQAEAVCYY